MLNPSSRRKAPRLSRTCQRLGKPLNSTGLVPASGYYDRSQNIHSRSPHIVRLLDVESLVITAIYLSLKFLYVGSSMAKQIKSSVL